MVKVAWENHYEKYFKQIKKIIKWVIGGFILFLGLTKYKIHK